MGQLELTAGSYRSLRLGSIAGALTDLLAQAEANEVSYLAFSDMLVEHERQIREAKRIDLYRRQAGSPQRQAAGRVRLTAPDHHHQPPGQRPARLRLPRQSGVHRPAGVGKTHLAIGIGQKAIEAG